VILDVGRHPLLFERARTDRRHGDAEKRVPKTAHPPKVLADIPRQREMGSAQASIRYYLHSGAY